MNLFVNDDHSFRQLQLVSGKRSRLSKAHKAAIISKQLEVGRMADLAPNRSRSNWTNHLIDRVSTLD